MLSEYYHYLPFAVVIFISALSVLVKMVKSKCLIKGILFSALSGIGSLFVVSFFFDYLGFHLSNNIFAMIYVCIFGTPGTISLLMLNILVR